MMIVIRITSLLSGHSLLDLLVVLVKTIEKRLMTNPTIPPSAQPRRRNLQTVDLSPNSPRNRVSVHDYDPEDRREREIPPTMREPRTLSLPTNDRNFSHHPSPIPSSRMSSSRMSHLQSHQSPIIAFLPGSNSPTKSFGTSWLSLRIHSTAYVPRVHPRSTGCVRLQPSANHSTKHAWPHFYIARPCTQLIAAMA